MYELFRTGKLNGPKVKFCKTSHTKVFVGLD